MAVTSPNKPTRVLQADPTDPSGLDEAVTPQPQSSEPPGVGPWVVRAYFTDRQMVKDLSAWREPWEVHRDQGYVVLDVNRNELGKLLAAGFRVEIDREHTALLNSPNRRLPDQTTGIPGFPCYLTVEETFAIAEDTVADYPELATWIDIGDSWEKDNSGGEPGYDMMVLRLTNSAIAGPKPKLFVMTSVHAREYTAAELGVRFAQYLTDNYDSDPDVTWLLNYHEIHLLLQANPDGRKWAEEGFLWRKNTDNDFCANTQWRGVDLNRNFEFGWGCCGGSSGFECDEVYRGPSPGSEPETQAIQNFVRAQFPDQREDDLTAAAPITATGVFLDIHSYGEWVLWPWGSIDTSPPNATGLQTLGRKLAFFNHYLPQQANLFYYHTDGTTDGFAYGELGLAAYTFELGTGFFQDCATFEDSILPDNLPALIYAAKVARTPYITPSGPDTVDLVVGPEPVTLGASVVLTASINDTRYNNRAGSEATQIITAAELYVDAPPWIATTPLPYAMNAADGGFDEKVEEVRATLSTSSLSGGRHIIYVRGQDADGNWGAFSAVFLNVVVTPTVEFTSSSPASIGKPVLFTNQSVVGSPVDFWWDFGDGQGNSTERDPSYTYRSVGTFTVTLVATNSLGNDRVSHAVVIGPSITYLPVVTKKDADASP
jgi:PKD repeat protein